MKKNSTDHTPGSVDVRAFDLRSSPPPAKVAPRVRAVFRRLGRWGGRRKGISRLAVVEVATLIAIDRGRSARRMGRLDGRAIGS